VFLLHSDKANYPEVAAYSAYLTGIGHRVESGDLDTYRGYGRGQSCVLWCLMGFFPSGLPAKRVIHDYRSLSIGKGARYKDLIKRHFNVKPDVRIFQNDAMATLMDFPDDVPSLRIPMGVPDALFEPAPLRRRAPRFAGKFCYLGAMSRERGFHEVLTSFAQHRRGSDKFVLIGAPANDIYRDFRDAPGLVFTGRLDQAEALATVAACQYAVSYFPYHRPHAFQTPTKLLEYAALGRRIVCNDSPANLACVSERGLPCLVTPRDVFSAVTDDNLAQLQPTDPEAVRSFGWSSVLARSGIDRFLE
jgi:glycosyltransferase involved in cell wall biosynthesis